MNFSSKINKKIVLLNFFLLLTCIPFFAKDAVFSLNPVKDSLLLGSGLILEGTGMSMEHFIDEKSWNGEVRNKDSVNSFDRFFMQNYDKSLDFSCDVLFASLALGQVALNFTAEKEEWLTVLTMTLETVLITDGTKRIIKKSVGRFRPYTYFENPSSDSDYAESWPSGHAMNGFALATFSSYVFSRYYPDSEWKWAVTSGAYGLASVMSVSRVACGAHFASDVLCGAAFGSAIGFLVPFMHQTNVKLSKNGSDVSFSVLPSGFLCKIQL